MKRTETRVKNGEFCRLEIELREHNGLQTLSICGTAGVVLSDRDAKREALAFWEGYFEEEPYQVGDLNERFGRRFRSPASAARFVLDCDGQYHGLDVVDVEDTDAVYVAHSCGQIREELARFFPEAVPFFRFHLNNMRAECVHQEARGESYKTHPGAECLECGHKLGHSWDQRKLPQAVIHWAETGEGHAPSQPHYIAGPQWVVRGERRELGALGHFAWFQMNGAAPTASAACERARQHLEWQYETRELLASEVRGSAAAVGSTQ